VLTQIAAGTELMKKEARMDGAVKVIQGLGAYAEHFDHPGWTPIEHWAMAAATG